VVAWLLAAAAVPAAGQAPVVEIVATSIQRPLEIAVDGRALIVLAPGIDGGVAGEIFRVSLDVPRPVNLLREPRVRIPFADGRLATLGSLAVDPRGHSIFLGEENGARVYRLTRDERLDVYAAGLRRLSGGTTIGFDGAGRLVVVDHIDPLVSPSEDRAAPGVPDLGDEDYRGPLVFRLSLDPTIPLPRRIDRLVPLFPRAWGGKAGGAHLPKLIAVAPLGVDDLVLLSSSGDLYRLASDGSFRLHARLPRGQYTRTHLVTAPDGTVYASGGFQVGALFRVAPDGAVTVLARDLADPQGIALDADGNLYLAESSLHRIIRVGGPDMAPHTPPRSSPPG
jgi:hypothetical protein